MLGAIIGDIVGSRFEFNNHLDKDFDFFHKDCSFTDDTICTIAIADAILKNRQYKDSLIEWCRKYPNPKGGYGTSFYRWLQMISPKPYNSFGNGAAMRVSPIGWAYNEIATVMREAMESAKVTHDHTEGLIGAVSVAEAIFFTRTNNLIIEDGKRTLSAIASYYYGNEWNFGNRLPKRGYFDETCQGCVPLAFYITIHSDSFEDAIRNAIAWGGDSDTLGAIVGAISEALFGIPSDMIDQSLRFLPTPMLKIIDDFKTKYKIRL